MHNFQQDTFQMQTPIIRDNGTRGNFNWAFIGASGYGKTADSIVKATKWRKYNPRKKIYSFDPKGDLAKSGLLINGFDYDIPVGFKDFGEELTKRRADKTFVHRDFLLILDDYKAILTEDRTPESFLTFCLFAREMNVDVILSTHSPALIIPRLAYYITHYSIFYSQGSAGGFQKKSNNYVACEQARILINKYVTEYGKGIENFPNFPHIVVEGINDKSIDCVNIDKQKMLKLL